MSELEDELMEKIEGAGLPVPVRQCKEPWEGTGRKFRGDFCWPDQKLLAEVDGGTWSGGRHTTGRGYESDCDKQNLAVMKGWTVVRFTNKHVRDGRAMDVIEALMVEVTR